VVLHGSNGSGKSNLLLAAQLVLRAAPATFPLGIKAPISLSLADADKHLGLRPEDFHDGGPLEIRVEIDIDLGTRAAELLRIPGHGLPKRMSLALAVEQSTSTLIRYWLERADFDGEASLAPAQKMALLGSLLQVSPAYRAPGTAGDPEQALFNRCLSADPLQRDAMRRFGKRLAAARLFGAAEEPVAIVPVKDERYGEECILLAHPDHGDLPLRNLGSGEQQLVYMLGQQVITPYPIAQIEEPEAHLHTSLMEPLAKILHESVAGDGGRPDVDQLWIATHHHHFALAETYFDVSLDAQGATRVEKQPRDEAFKHFYEPHPYWETLRTLVEDERLDEETILVEDDAGPIRARDVLASIHGDRVVANRYVAAASRSLVLSLAEERRGK
jgi:hypothetical protein